MTTWTMDQVRQARGIRAKAHLDIIEVKRGGEEVWEFTRGKMFRNMSEIAHTFAIELDPRDLRFSQEDRGFEVLVAAWWEPETREVELRGGRADGQIAQLEGAPHRQLMLPAPPPPAWLGEADGPIEPPHPDEYRCTGWSESHRRWIYEAR